MLEVVAISALPIGITFGALLERAGLGDARVIAAQFTGRNFAVVRVMFAAIVTAMLGVVLLNSAGLINAGSISMPPTDIAGQAIGAVIFGGGFALASLCPGTACVAAASGKREGFITVAGLLPGTLLTVFLWPIVDGVIGTTVRERATLDADLGVPAGLVVFAVTVMAVMALTVARRLDASQVRQWNRPSTPEAVAVALAGMFALTEAKPATSPARLAAIASEISREGDHVDPLELADWIKNGKKGLRVIDVREEVDSSTYVIPGARVVALDSVPALKIGSGDIVVLYSDGGTHAAQAWVLLRARGVRNTFVLKDGMAAWEDEVMSPVLPSTMVRVENDSVSQRFEKARALSLWFGGHPRTASTATEGESSARDGLSSRTTGGGKARPFRRRNTC